jgi:hypothetical protein
MIRPTWWRYYFFSNSFAEKDIKCCRLRTTVCPDGVFFPPKPHTYIWLKSVLGFSWLWRECFPPKDTYLLVGLTIKKRLRWLGDSFRMYLRDTLAIQLQHVNALCKASREVMDLISALPTDIIAMSISMTDGTNDPDRNKYANKMD